MDNLLIIDRDLVENRKYSFLECLETFRQV